MVPTQRELYWKLGFGIQAVGCGSYCPMSNLDIDQKLIIKIGLRRHTEYGQGVQGSKALGRGKQMAGRETMRWANFANDTNQPPRGFWVNRRSLQLKFMPTAPILPKEMRYWQFSSVLLTTQVATETKQNKKTNKKLDITTKQNH
jgi:hypothetical protein